jgi:hypothetical protein
MPKYTSVTFGLTHIAQKRGVGDQKIAQNTSRAISLCAHTLTGKGWPCAQGTTADARTRKSLEGVRMFTLVCA